LFLPTLNSFEGSSGALPKGTRRFLFLRSWSEDPKKQNGPAPELSFTAPGRPVPHKKSDFPDAKGEANLQRG
jgi:hypothetical protein